MHPANQNRDKAAEYKRLRDAAGNPNERRRFQQLSQRFKALADNEDWLAGNQGGIVQSADTVRTDSVGSTQQEEHILRRPGASAPDPAQD